MPQRTLEQAQQLVDALTPQEQVRLLAYLTARVAQVVLALPPPMPSAPPVAPDPWDTFFQLGEALMATDTPTGDTLTTAVLAMRR